MDKKGITDGNKNAHGTYTWKQASIDDIGH